MDGVLRFSRIAAEQTERKNTAEICWYQTKNNNIYMQIYMRIVREGFLRDLRK